MAADCCAGWVHRWRSSEAELKADSHGAHGEIFNALLDKPACLGLPGWNGRTKTVACAGPADSIASGKQLFVVLVRGVGIYFRYAEAVIIALDQALQFLSTF